MPRPKNDGRGRLGGRAKGTPNKTTSTVKEWLAQLVDSNRKQIEKDLKGMDPAYIAGDTAEVLIDIICMLGCGCRKKGEKIDNYEK